MKRLFFTLAAVALISCAGKSKSPAAETSMPPVAASDMVPSEPPKPTAQPQSSLIPAGATITVRTLYLIESEFTPRGKFIPAIVDDNVMGADGRLAIPSGTPAVILVLDIGRQGAISHASLGLFSFELGGRTHRFGGGAKEAAILNFSEDAARGASHRSIHLVADSRLSFKLDAPLDLR